MGRTRLFCASVNKHDRFGDPIMLELFPFSIRNEMRALLEQFCSPPRLLTAPHISAKVTVARVQPAHTRLTCVIDKAALSHRVAAAAASHLSRVFV